MAVELILESDSLNKGRVKINNAITGVNNYDTKLDAALQAQDSKLTTALTGQDTKLDNALSGFRSEVNDNINSFKSEVNGTISEFKTEITDKTDNFQTQIDQIVVQGDSSVEAAQARVQADGTTYPTLKARLDHIDSEIAGGGGGSSETTAEVVAARTEAGGTVNASLKARLDKRDAIVDNNVSKTTSHIADMIYQKEVHGMRATGGKFEYNNGSSWVEVSGEIPPEVVKSTTSVITYYVSPTGNDQTGDGTSGNPFKTINFTLGKLPQVINDSITISLSQGTYDEAVSISGFFGRGSISLSGAGTVATTHSITTLEIIDCHIRVIIVGINVTSTTFVPVNIERSSVVTLSGMNIVSTFLGGNGIRSSYSTVSITSSTISNKSGAIVSTNLSNVFSSGNTGTNNTTALTAAVGGTIAKNSTQPTATTAEYIASGGVIR